MWKGQLRSFAYEPSFFGIEALFLLPLLWYRALELKEKHGLSFIFICHNLALVQMFCDRVLVLYEGKVVEGGTPDEIINYPKMEYTQNLIDSVL